MIPNLIPQPLHSWGRLGLCLLLTTVMPNHGVAGQRKSDDSGGVLYLSLAPEIAYDDTTSYRGLSALPPPEQAIVETDPSSKARIAYVLAAFGPHAQPDVSVVSFGIQYSGGIRIVRYGITPDAVQMATRDWPLRKEGMLVAWINNKADTTRVMEIGWIAFVAAKPGHIDLVPHPDPQMATRFVASRTAEMWPVAGFGRLGFGEPGRAPLPLPDDPPLGAACIYDSVCVMLTQAEAEYYKTIGDAVFLGVGIICGAGPYCFSYATPGACCLSDGRCKLVTRKECVRLGGVFRGEDTRCEPDPCAGDHVPGTGVGGDH